MVLKYAFVSEYTSAAGRFLAVIAKMSTDLSADRGTVFADLCSDTREVPTKSKTSLDHKPVVIGKMFHSESFPAGYRENFTLIIGKIILKSSYGFMDNRRRAMDKCMDSIDCPHTYPQPCGEAGYPQAPQLLLR